MKWNDLVREDFLTAALVLPIAHAWIRAPVASRIAATDATPSSGGSCEVEVNSELASEIYRFTENKGCYIRLDGRADQRDTLRPAAAPIERLCQSMPWRVRRSHLFEGVLHINIQELKEALNELKDVVRRCPGRIRFLLAVDSNVVLGCWTKGRSSSFVLNLILRKICGWSVVGRSTAALFRLSTEGNVADEPSRFKPLRAPTPSEDWMDDLLRGDPAQGFEKARQRCHYLRLGYLERELEPAHGRALGHDLRG